MQVSENYSYGKVLIIDDVSFNRSLLAKILTDEGLGVIEAENAAIGVFRAAHEKPDLILLDIMMPDIDGYAACQMLVSDPQTFDIPVIFISALESPEARVRGFKVGAVDYILRPFHKDEVVARVKVHLRIRLAHKQLLEEGRSRILSLRNAESSFLTDPSSVPEANAAVWYEPANEIGGDFYEILALSKDFSAYFVSDVSGHDIGSALVHSAIKLVLQSWAIPLYTPVETMQMMNSMLKPLFKSGEYLTAVFLFINRKAKTASIVSCGHPPVLMSRSDGVVKELRIEGDPIGVYDGPCFGHIELDLEDDARFWMYTDGITQETQNLAQLIKKTAEKNLAEALDSVVLDIASAMHEPQKDDCLILACDAVAKEGQNEPY